MFRKVTALMMAFAIFTVLTAPAFAAEWGNASGWAQAELEIAVQIGIFPDKLLGADMTQPITRAEFAEVVVKLYEVLGETAAEEASQDTFADTVDSDVRKAYQADLVGGVGNRRFAPAGLLTREQASVMLTRICKKLDWEGWTLAGDESYAEYTLDTEGSPQFSDASKIGDWALESVNFMAKYGILKGTGENNFVPQNNCSRQEALIIAKRLWEMHSEVQYIAPADADSDDEVADEEIPDEELSDEDHSVDGEAGVSMSWNPGGMIGLRSA